MAGPQVPKPARHHPGSPGGPAPIALQERAGCAREPVPTPPSARHLSPRALGLPGEQGPWVPPAVG